MYTHSPYDEKHISCLTSSSMSWTCFLSSLFSILFYRLCVVGRCICAERVKKKKNRIFPFSCEASHVISFQTYVDSMIVNMNFKLIFTKKIIFAFHAIFNFCCFDKERHWILSLCWFCWVNVGACYEFKRICVAPPIQIYKISTNHQRSKPVLWVCLFSTCCSRQQLRK